MIQKALQYIVGLGQPNQIIKDGETFVDRDMHRMRAEICTDSIELTTLSSLIDYLKDNPNVFYENKLIVQVESPTSVHVYSQISEKFDLEKKTYVSVNADVPDFCFGRWYDNERFIINMQSKFKDFSTEEMTSGGVVNDKPAVLQFAGTAQDGTIANYGDTGVTQSATIKTGVLDAEDKIIPNPVTLIPYRTFVEVEQPASRFIFRMRSNNGIECALFEADGGAWKNEAMQNIKEYLKKEIGSIKHEGLDFVVIA